MNSPQIITGKRKRKPRRVLQMHMGSSRTYGFADEEDPVVQKEPKKKTLKVQASTLKGSAKKKQKPVVKANAIVYKKKKGKKNASRASARKNGINQTGVLDTHQTDYNTEYMSSLKKIDTHSVKIPKSKKSGGERGPNFTMVKQNHGTKTARPCLKSIDVEPNFSTSPSSSSKKSRLINQVAKNHPFSVQTVLKLVPAMKNSERVCKIKSNKHKKVTLETPNLFNSDTSVKNWACAVCGDLNRIDQTMCSMCFSHKDVSSDRLETKNGNYITEVLQSIVTDKDYAEVSSTSIVENRGWRASETFIRWWRRGLMTGLQSKLPLLSPPVSSQPTFRQRNTSASEPLPVHPRVAKLDDGFWVQCSMCLKYRRLPRSIRISDLPKVWFCRYNKYDPSRAECRAPEEQFTYSDDDIKRISDDHDNLSFLDKLRHYYDVTGKVVRLRSLTLGGRELSLYRLYNEVQARGGCAQVMSEKGTWAKIFRALENYSKTETSASFRLKNIYRKYLLEYENHQRALATANNEPLPSECAAPITMMT
eukprot:g5544.t1